MEKASCEQSVRDLGGRPLRCQALLVGGTGAFLTVSFERRCTRHSSLAIMYNGSIGYSLTLKAGSVPRSLGTLSQTRESGTHAFELGSSFPHKLERSVNSSETR
jgi:hypothetical protein